MTYTLIEQQDGLWAARVHKDGQPYGIESKSMTMIEVVEWLALVANVPVQVRDYIIKEKVA